MVAAGVAALALVVPTIGVAQYNPTYPWDVNGDDVVDVSDAVLIGLHWGETGPPGWIPEDVNRDGVIDITDVTVVGLRWGEHTPSAGPTPTATPPAAGGTSVSVELSTLNATAGVYTLSAPTTSPPVGSTWMVDIDISLNPGLMAGGIEFALQYDPNILQFRSLTEGSGGFISSWASTHAAQVFNQTWSPVESPGLTRVGGLALIGGPPGQGPTGAGRVATATFTVIGSGAIALGLQPVHVTIVDLVNGQVEAAKETLVAAGPGATATVTPTPAPATTTPVPTLTPSLSPTPTLTVSPPAPPRSDRGRRRWCPPTPVCRLPLRGRPVSSRRTRRRRSSPAAAYCWDCRQRRSHCQPMAPPRWTSRSTAIR